MVDDDDDDKAPGASEAERARRERQLLKGLRARVEGGERTKVLLSIDTEDLRAIDERAVLAGMSRSAYMVSMARQGDAGVFDAIHRLQLELARFASENGGRKKIEEESRAEIDRLQRNKAEARELLKTLRELTEAIKLEDRVQRVFARVFAAVDLLLKP
jgi:hypothetical protein